MKRTESSQGTASEGEPSLSYADSDVSSSPRSGKPPEDCHLSGRWDEVALSKVKLMCSYGGRILPRPHDNQLRYVGGDSRLVVVPRNVTFSDLLAKLSKTFGTEVLVKYQLPCEDLDALISVTSDEDLEIMMEENDRLQQQGLRSSGASSSSSASGTSTRLRLFLFPTKVEQSPTSSLSEMLESTQSREKLFVDILNGMPPPLPHVRSETSSIISENAEYLFGQDTLEEWAAAASYGVGASSAATSYGAGTAPSSSTLVVASSGSLEKTSGLIIQGLGGPPALLGSFLQHHTAMVGGEASSAAGTPLQTRQLVGSSSASPCLISINPDIATAATCGDVKHFVTPTVCVAVEVETTRPLDNHLEHCQEQHGSSSDISAIVTGGNKQESEAGSVRSLSSEVAVDDGNMTHQQTMTTMPIYDDDGQSPAPPSPMHLEQVRALKIEDKQDFGIEESAPCHKVQGIVKTEIAAQAVEVEVPYGVAVGAAKPPTVFFPPRIQTKFPPLVVNPVSNAEAPLIVTALPSATMMQKRDGAPHVEANLHPHQQLVQEVSTELDPRAYVMQGPGIQFPAVVTHRPIVNPTPGTAATNVGVIKTPVYVGASKPVYAGAHQAAVVPVVGAPHLSAQPIHAGLAHPQLSQMGPTSSVLEHGAIPTKVQHVPRDPTHQFQRAVASPVSAVTNTREASYQYATPFIGQAVPTIPLRYHGHLGLQQVPSTIAPTLHQVTPAMMSSVHGRPDTPLPAQYYYVVDQPPVTVANVFFPKDAVGIAPRPQTPTVAMANPFIDDLHLSSQLMDPSLVALQPGTESNRAQP